MANWFQRCEENVILRNEAAWSRKTCENDVLPKSAERELVELKKLGFEEVNLPEKFKYDGKYFIGMKLPMGWTKVADREDPRHISVMDTEGNKKARIFVKLGGYDQFTSFSLC